jgi:hypothetical protein
MSRSLAGPLATLLVALSLFAPERAHAEDTWRYVVPAAGDAFEHPPLRVVALSAEKPEGLKEKARYRGAKQRYARLTYGSPGTARVALVLDEISASETDLYLDTQRSGTITAEDRVPGKDGAWRVSLDAVVSGAKAGSAPRTVLFRLGRVSRTLSLATCGYLEGRVPIGRQLVTVRRVDGDGNGLFADPADRLWLDRDGKGRWDPLEDQYLFSPILSLGGERYVVSSDALGQRLAFRKLEGEGTVGLALGPSALAERVQDVTVTLMGRDGSVFTLHGRDPRATLPVGDYRLSLVALTLKDPSGGEPWSFVFSDNGGKPSHHWHTLKKDGRLALDPVGKLSFLASLPEDERPCRPGQTLNVQTQLFTGDGLLIASAGRGSVESGHGGSGAAVALVGSDGRSLATSQAGFA